MATVFIAVGASTNTAFERATYTRPPSHGAAWINAETGVGLPSHPAARHKEEAARLPAGSYKEQQRGRRENGIANRKCPLRARH